MWLLLVACVPRLYTDGTGDTGDTASVVWTAPENRWPLTPPPADLEPVGWGDGDVVPDIRLVDQYGDTVSLWQFYGNVVFLDISTLWCIPCRDLAGEAQATQDDYADRGFVYQTVLSENMSAEACTEEEVQAWVDAFGLTGLPVTNDHTHAVATAITPENAFPALLVIGRDLTVKERVPTASDEAVRAAIEAHLE